MLNMKEIVGSHDIVLITLDTLRYDIAQQELEAGRLPMLSHHINSWEKRHAPASFTYPAHQAIFAGFMPTPAENPHQPRLFALSFPGSETIDSLTYTFDTPTIIEGLANENYRTACIGGVGFFNQQTALGCVLPNLFEHSQWSSSLGVTDKHSTQHQVNAAKTWLQSLGQDELAFLFINISAIHQPNCHYIEDTEADNLNSHAAALRYVDSALAPLFEYSQQRRDTLYLVMSDHGTAYGEEGYQGHRLAHEVVWTVPYAEFIIKGNL